MFKYIYTSLICCAIFLVSFNFKFSRKSYIPNSSQPNTGLTSSSGSYCTNCHGAGDNGSVQIQGIPSSILPNTTYNFSVTISHTVRALQAPRKRWGFSMNARDVSNSVDVGTFATTNPNTNINLENELTHYNAQFVPEGSSYTYSNLSWTSPATIDGLITFYFAGNATNGDGTNGGDFAYASSFVVGTLPVNIGHFSASVVRNNQVQLDWNTLTEKNTHYFEIQESVDGVNFLPINKVYAVGHSSNTQNYAYLHTKPAAFNKPIFFRLKIVDRDGQFTYSKLTNIRLEAMSDFVQSFSPTFIQLGGNASISLVSSKEQHASIQIVNMLGQKMQTQEFNLSIGTNKVNIESRKLNSGKYFVIVQFGSVSQTVSILVE
jgi:hypothetical protein